MYNFKIKNSNLDSEQKQTGTLKIMDKLGQIWKFAKTHPQAALRIGAVVALVVLVSVLVSVSVGTSQEEESSNSAFKVNRVRRTTPNVTVETSTEMTSTEEISESSSSSTPTSEPTTMTSTTTELTETTTTTTTTTTPPPQYIDVYAYNNFGDPRDRFQIFPDCFTLPSNWHKRIASVNTNGHCVQICRDAACRGNCMILRQGSMGHNRLRDINFDKQTKSVRQC